MMDKNDRKMWFTAVDAGAHVDLKLRFKQNLEDKDAPRTFTHLFAMILDTLSKTSMQAEVDNVIRTINSQIYSPNNRPVIYLSRLPKCLPTIS